MLMGFRKTQHSALQNCFADSSEYLFQIHTLSFIGSSSQLPHQPYFNLPASAVAATAGFSTFSFLCNTPNFLITLFLAKDIHANDFGKVADFRFCYLKKLAKATLGLKMKV